MLFMVEMTVNKPHNVDEAKFAAEVAEEKAKAKALQEAGTGDTFGAWRDSIPMSASSMSKARLRFTN